MSAYRSSPGAMRGRSSRSYARGRAPSGSRGWTALSDRKRSPFGPPPPPPRTDLIVSRIEMAHGVRTVVLTGADPTAHQLGATVRFRVVPGFEQPWFTGQVIEMRWGEPEWPPTVLLRRQLDIEVVVAPPDFDRLWEHVMDGCPPRPESIHWRVGRAD